MVLASVAIALFTVLCLSCVHATTAMVTLQQIEAKVQEMHTSLYAVGQPDLVPLNEIKRLTDPSQGVYMFGYFDKTPWSPDSSSLLVTRIPSFNTTPAATDVMEVGLIRLAGSSSSALEPWQSFEQTTAWNHQQGSMLQWLGLSGDLVIFNDRLAASDPIATDAFCAVVYSLSKQQRVRQLPMPIYSVNRQGTLATSVNFGRIALTRAGYGYNVSKSYLRAEFLKKIPQDDGIWLMDLTQDVIQPKLILSTAKVWEAIKRSGRFDNVTGLPYATKIPSNETQSQKAEAKCLHWFNHIHFNREGDKLLFLYRLGHCSYGKPFATYVFMYDLQTEDLWRVPLVVGSHHDFGWYNTAISCDSSGYYEIKFKERVRKLTHPPLLSAAPGDGHCTFSPTVHRYVLSDTYPYQQSHRTLFLWDRERNTVKELGSFKPLLEGKGFTTRVDLHPRWSRDGRYACFDSTHEGLGRQVYVTKLMDKQLVMDSKVSVSRKVFVDLGARSGDTMRHFVTDSWDSTDYDVFLFECNPENMLLLNTNVEALRTRVRSLELMEAAAWTEDGHLEFHMDTRALGADGKPGKTGGSLFASPYAKGSLVKVQSIRFSTWLQRTVTMDDYVICKMDVEGAEFDLLADMVMTGSLVLCDVMKVEWHQRFRQEFAAWPGVFAKHFKSVGIVYHSHW